MAQCRAWQRAGPISLPTGDNIPGIVIWLLFWSVDNNEASKAINCEAHWKQEHALNVLLLIAHGSRKEVANHEVRELAAQIEKHSASDYEAVVPAFLEFTQPDIGNGIDYCVKSGAKNITVFPYFLSAGAHVNRDVPEQVEIASQRHPGVNFHLTRHFGCSDSIVESVIDCASQPTG